MSPLYPLVKNHLHLAKKAINGRDERASELRRIIDLTIKLLEHYQSADSTNSNVIDFCEARRRRNEN